MAADGFLSWEPFIWHLCLLLMAVLLAHLAMCGWKLKMHENWIYEFWELQLMIGVLNGLLYLWNCSGMTYFLVVTLVYYRWSSVFWKHIMMPWVEKYIVRALSYTGISYSLVFVKYSALVLVLSWQNLCPSFSYSIHIVPILFYICSVTLFNSLALWIFSFLLTVPHKFKTVPV